jgi:hypothetical protein
MYPETVTAKFRAETLANCGQFSAQFSRARDHIIAEMEPETVGNGLFSSWRLVAAI